MNKQIISIAAITSIFFACNNSNGESTEKTNVISDTVAVGTVESEHHTESESIELNNGLKWKVVPEMMKFIKTMESEVNHFSETSHSQLSEYVELSLVLQKNIDLLTSNCTMEGKAHDELHKWLVPYIETVEKMKSSKNIDEAKEHYNYINQSFNTLNNYFE